MTIATKETPSALQELLRAKGSSKDIPIVQNPTVVVENSTIEAPATPAPNPDEPSVPATLEQDQEPVDTRDYKQSYKELKTHHDKTTHELRLQLQAKDNQLLEAVKPVVKAPKTAEELKAFKEQYPEAYDVMESIVLNKLQDESLDIRKQTNEVLQTQAKLREEKAFAELLKEHPDANEIKEDPKFAAWFNEQPDAIKNILATSLDHRAISKQLTLYKMEVLGYSPKDKKKAEIKEKEDASLAVKVKGQSEISPQKKIWTGTELRQIGANYKEWLKHKDEIDNARRENRVDMTK